MHIMSISEAVQQREQSGALRDGRWTNSPHDFPDLGLTGTVLSNALVPFPPNDQRLKERRIYRLWSYNTR